MKSYQNALKIVNGLKERGFAALFAGGCVRDMVMIQRGLRGVEATDYDISTDAPVEQITSIFPRTIPIGSKFGSVIVVMDGQEYDVTRFRKEGVYKDGRHPEEVEFLQEQREIRQDALRRDFTINGMFYDPAKDEIIDHVGGIRDIEDGIIRAIGAPRKRFEEDKLRMIRAVRFASRYGYKIEEETLSAIEEMSDKIEQVSPERIRDEVIMIITDYSLSRGVRLLIETSLMDHIIPEVGKMDGVEQPPEFHPEGDVLTHTLMLLDYLESPSPELAMGVLLHDVGKPPTFRIADRIRFDNHARVGAEMAEKICRRLRFSNDQTEHITQLVRNHLKFMHVKDMKESTLKRFLRMDKFGDHLELHRVDCKASHGDLSNWKFCREKFETLKQDQISPLPLLNGHDLIEAGYTPGPIFKKILTFAEDLQLEGVVATKDRALQLVKEKFPPISSGI